MIKDYKGTCFEKEKMCMDKSIYIKYCNIPLNKKKVNGNFHIFPTFTFKIPLQLFNDRL